MRVIVMTFMQRQDYAEERGDANDYLMLTLWVRQSANTRHTVV